MRAAGPFNKSLFAIPSKVKKSKVKTAFAATLAAQAF